MQHSNKALAASELARRWSRLPCALLLALVLLASGCTKEVGDIGVGLPSANANTGAYLLDTLTVRASTVLRDSVVTSNQNYLLVGRYTDPLLGTLTAKSYVRLGLSGTFVPDPTAVFDSVTLVLKPDAYRYGDTTKTQSLFEVHRLNPQTPLSVTTVSYASERLTTPPAYAAAPLNYNLTQKTLAVPVRRARPTLTTLRLPLDPAFGQEILTLGQTGRLSTQDDFDALVYGLAITSAATDDAAILRLSATDATSALVLYYHLPTDPTTVVSSSFSLVGGGRHFFQVTADRSTAGISPKLPTRSLTAVSAADLGQQTVVEGALGLQTRLEFPYLTDVQQFGPNLTVTSAQLTALVPAYTLSPFVPTPPGLIVSISDANNHPIGTYISGTQGAGIPYLSAISSTTGLQQGSYQWSVATYCQQVINRTIPNNGLLLSSAAPALTDRVILGGPRNTDNKLQLRLYFITVK